MIDAKTIRELLEYCPETGVFTWRRRKNSQWSAMWAEKPAGHKHKYNGYIVIALFDKRYMAHRLAWLYIYGEWPSGEIDHINLDKTDHRIANLRIATRSQNCGNTPLRKDNTSGAKGGLLAWRNPQMEGENWGDQSWPFSKQRGRP